MKLLFLLPLLFAFLFLAACGRVDCVTTTTAIGVWFTGYEADTGIIIIVSQLPGNGPSAPIERDTLLIDSNRLYRETNDSIGGRHRVRVGLSIYEGYDWQVDVPATGKRDYISGIEFTRDTREKKFMEGGKSSNQCINVCTGYYLNGNYVATRYTAAVPYGGSTDVYVTLNKH